MPPRSLDLRRVMSTPAPLRISNSWIADENPTSLTIRRVEAADANGHRSILGENAARLRFELAHTERSKSSNANRESARFAKADLGVNAENSGFLKVQSSTFGPSTGKSRAEEDDSSKLGSRGEKSGLRGPEDVEIEANKDASQIGFGAGGYGSGIRVGGKLRSLRRGNKRTPYDRPVTGRHATAGGSAAMVATSLPSSKVSVASRLRDSASRFIYSSASYVLSALFKRAPPSVAATGESKHRDVEEEMHKETLQTPLKQIERTVGPGSQVLALMDAGVKPRETEERVLDIGQIEEILKQKTWSREQVNQLTRILQSCVSENDATNLIVEAAEKIEEQSKLEAKDASPVQVARAYMGEQATRPSGIAPTVHKSTFLSTEVQPSPVCTLKDSYLSSPFSRNWARSSAAVQMPKRSLAREGDLASMGPVRRVRQKTSMLTNASPYSWCMTGLSKPLEMRASSPRSQSSQTALKILETLEILSPSPEGKFLDISPEKSNIGLRVAEKLSPNLKGKLSNEFVCVARTSAIEQTLESSVHNLGLVPSPKSTELKPISRITFEGTNFNNSVAVMKSGVEAAPSISEFHNIMPVLGKGFRMNAVFEESNSDEESKLQAKQHVSTEARDCASHHNLKEEPKATPDSVVVASTAADHSGSFLSEPVQASASSVPMLKYFSMPVMPSLPDKSEPLVTTVSQVRLATHGFSFSPVAVETRSPLPGEMASSQPASAELKPPAEKVLSIPNAAGANPAQQAEGSEMTIASKTTLTLSSTFSEFAITSVPLMASVSTTAPLPLRNSSTEVNAFSSHIQMTSKTDICGMDVPEVGNERTMATESPVADKLVEVDTMATDSIADEADVASMAPSASPISGFLSSINAQPSSAPIFSYLGVSSTPSSAVTFPFSGGLGTASPGTSASLFVPSFVFGGQSGTASAGQAPGFSIGSSASCPSAAAAFTFGSQSNSVSAGQLPTFAIGVSASSSPSASFAFGGQSGTSPAGQAPSYVAKTVLFDQSGAGSTGQALSFAMPSAPANPFSSTGGSSPFMFGSSTAAAFSSSAAPAFGSSAVFSTTAVSTSSSSGLPGAGVLSTFQFVSAMGTSSSTSVSSVSSMTTNSFTTAPFLSLAAPILSTNPTFSFGSSAALSFSASTSPSRQLFAQPNPFAAYPLSSSGVQNLAPSSFGAAAVAVIPPFFSSSGSLTSIFASNAVPNTSNMFTFGSNSTPNTSAPFTCRGAGLSTPIQGLTPATFAFGGQPTGQPFGFSGRQPPAPASDPFSAAQTTPGPEFTGGFTLGATSGDKSGRKYIKARRTGGAKPGK